MFDFVTIEKKIDKKKGCAVLYPSFLIMKSKDLMTKGKSFYAIWDEEYGMWSKSETRAAFLIDDLIRIEAEEFQELHPDLIVSTQTLLRYNSKRMTEFQGYCKTLEDNYEELDSDVTFMGDKVTKEDYRSIRLGYPLIEAPYANYDELMSTLYDVDERQKIEWAIGSIISGDSKDIQKFYVFYGEPGSGKSTVLKIIKKLFNGYCATFDAKAVGSSGSAFALEPFKDNPLVAIQDDGDLYHIEDNTRLNSIASHESLVVNEKHKSTYSAKFNSVMFIGTNKPVRITDSKSGVIRRLIDISPSGHTLPRKRYDAIMEQIDFELSGIAWHCFNVYKEHGKKYYDKYKPMNMMGITNDFYVFMDDSYEFFYEHKDRIQLKRAWQKYKEYVEDSNTQYPFTLKAFKEELKTYFDEYHDRKDGERKVYCGFQHDKFNYKFESEEELEAERPLALSFDYNKSNFDILFADCKAQYANDKGLPPKKWDEVTTTLKDLDTHKLHYMLFTDPQHIVIDFDLKNDKGEKDFELNMAAASKWPPTYAELSKSGAGIHLHYIYTGDVSKLSRIFAEDIEVKVFTGKSSLRRCLTKCNNLPIAEISSGLPLKGEKVVNFEAMKSEKQLRALINNCLDKKHHGATKPEVDYIYDTLEKCYESGMKYDVTDMRPDIQAFANNSSHHGLECLKLVSKMKFKSEEPSENNEDYGDAPIIFFDCEVFPNLFVLCWKFAGGDKPMVRMINPQREDVEALFKYRMIGYNCRRYDNHILYAWTLGYSNEELFELSSRIVSSEKKDRDKNCYFAEAYNLSYTDVYDYSTDKKSLKRWEIDLGIHHQENEHPWNEPVPEEFWNEICDYCENDVYATEVVHNHLYSEFKARLILAELSGLSANDTTNSHTTRLIVGKDRNPQVHYIYSDLSEEFPGYKFNEKGIPKEEYNPGTKIVSGKSIYMGEDPSEGGYAFATPGMYVNVALLDIASMHPTSAIVLKIFGEEYTTNFAQIKQIRIHIKHKEYDKVRSMFDGKLAKFLENDDDAAGLSYALKIAINSVYGLTSAPFPNKLKDPRNVDNIVAKRGALFMINLKHEVQKKGFVVAHIKTDSIKIPNATPEIIQFVMDYGKQYGYDFEHEATYERMCIVNDAVYIAKYANGKHAGEWVAVGAEFQHPFIFKTLFSHEPITFKDYCEVKSVQKGSLYLDFNENLPDDTQLVKERDKLYKAWLKENIRDAEETLESYDIEIEKCHNYKFVGRVGEFVPIKHGEGGGKLVRITDRLTIDQKVCSATGCKDWRWLDAETVKSAGYEDKIDMAYFNKLVDDVVDHIKEFGDFEWFVSDDMSIPERIMVDVVSPEGGPEELPWDEAPKPDFMNPPNIDISPAVTTAFTF